MQEAIVDSLYKRWLACKLTENRGLYPDVAVRFLSLSLKTRILHLRLDGFASSFS
jgi:hypothetical protein